MLNPVEATVVGIVWKQPLGHEPLSISSDHKTPENVGKVRGPHRASPVVAIPTLAIARLEKRQRDNMTCPSDVAGRPRT